MAVEPVSLLYSKPSKPTQARGKLLPLNTPSRQENPSPEAAGPTPEAPAGPSAEGDLEVDFEKIYKYLSSISHSYHGPELSPAGEKDGGGGCGGGVQAASPDLLLPFSSPSTTRVSCGPGPAHVTS